MDEKRLETCDVPMESLLELHEYLKLRDQAERFIAERPYLRTFIQRITAWKPEVIIGENDAPLPPYT